MPNTVPLVLFWSSLSWLHYVNECLQSYLSVKLTPMALTLYYKWREGTFLIDRGEVAHFRCFKHRSAYGSGPHGCAESVYPKVRPIMIRTCHSIYLIYRIKLYGPAIRRRIRAVHRPPGQVLWGLGFGLEWDELPQEFWGLLERRKES